MTAQEVGDKRCRFLNFIEEALRLRLKYQSDPKNTLTEGASTSITSTSRPKTT